MISRAVQYAEQGEEAQLHIVERPVPPRRKGQVLIRNYAAGVNPVDFKVIKDHLWLGQGQGQGSACSHSCPGSAALCCPPAAAA